MRYPAPLNCLAGNLPSLIQFRIVLVDTFRYPAAPCTVRGSSPSARFTSRRSSSGSDVSIIKTSPTIFIISPFADKVIRAADSLIVLNFDSYLARANQGCRLPSKHLVLIFLGGSRWRCKKGSFVASPVNSGLKYVSHRYICNNKFSLDATSSSPSKVVKLAQRYQMRNGN